MILGTAAWIVPRCMLASPHTRLACAALVAFGTAAWPSAARAADSTELVTSTASRTKDATAVEAEPKLSYWADTKPRWFVGGKLEGGLYLKPQIFFGYGQPHWIWAGLVAYPIATTSFAAAYAGLRFSLPIFDIGVGVRDSFSYDRAYLVPKRSYVASDVNSSYDRPHVRYLTVEGNISGVVPLPGSFLVASVDAYYLPDVPKDMDLYEESLRVVARAPWVIGNRLAYAIKLGKNGFIKAGVLAELVLVPERDTSTFRLGPAGVVSITDHLDGLAALSVPIASRDKLGIFQGSFGVLGLSYSWASGDEHPHFP